jgi:hypothetical protein
MVTVMTGNMSTTGVVVTVGAKVAWLVGGTAEGEGVTGKEVGETGVVCVGMAAGVDVS